MRPIRFSGGTHRLYGVLHEPTQPGFAGRGAVLCNPFGQKAIRSHRVFRVLAERLARAGVAALRFDYYGTGESDGDDDEVSLVRWAADLRSADRELRARFACREMCWLGLRAGAAVAALAAAGASPAPDRLILWDPVTDGDAFLETAARSHATGLARALPALGPDATAAGPGNESMGFVLPPAFVDEVRTISADTFAATGCRRIAWITPLAADAMPVLPPSTRASHHRVASIDWSTDEAMNAAIVPADVVAAALAEATAA